jgi:hypothetical protein
LVIEWIRVRAKVDFTYLVGGGLFAMGLVEILGAFDPAQALNIEDPIFGIPFRYLMLASGTIDLAVCLILLFTRWRTAGLMLAAWAAANFLVFRGGMWTMGWQHSSGFMVPCLGLSPAVTDAIISSFFLFLLIGSGSALWFEQRTALASHFLKVSCPGCGGHIKFSVQQLGQQIACPHCRAGVKLRRADALLKMACFFCHGHIEFPPHALGQKMPCPHCNMDITLKEPA